CPRGLAVPRDANSRRGRTAWARRRAQERSAPLPTLRSCAHLSLEKRIRGSARGLLGGDRGFQARDLLLEEGDALAQLLDREQRQVLANLVNDLLLGPVVVFAQRHGRVLKIAGELTQAAQPCHIPLGRIDMPAPPFFTAEVTMSTPPSRITAIAIRAPGAPEVRVPEERETPAPAGSEVLVKVAAAGVNRPDVMQRMGLYPPPKGASDIPGLEIAGEVVALGREVKRWR